MSIPNRQIGTSSSTENTLLHNILKQLERLTQVISTTGGGGGSGITIGTTTITSGTDTRVLYNNSGVVGEYSINGTGDVVMNTSPTISSPTISGPTFSGSSPAIAPGVKFTFSPDATSAGFNFGPTTADPSSLTDGDAWYRSDTDEIKVRINGGTTTLATGSGSGWPLTGSASLTGTVTMTLGTNPLLFTSTVTTGTGATAGHQMTFNSLSSGIGLDISSTSTAAASNTQRLVSIALSGANATGSQTTAALTVLNTHTGAGINKALVLSSSGGTTNHALDIQAGNILLSGTSQTMISNSSLTLGTSGANSFLVQTTGINRLVINSTGEVTFTGTAVAGGTHTPFSVTTPANTGQAASTEAIQVRFNVSATTQFSTGALTTQRFGTWESPILSFTGASTATTVSSFSFGGPVKAGTNATITKSIGVNIETRDVSGGSGVTTSVGLVANAPTGATTNIAIESVGSIKFSGTNSTGAGTALLGTNSPAVTVSAPYTWLTVITSDGSIGYIPVWK